MNYNLIAFLAFVAFSFVFWCITKRSYRYAVFFSPSQTQWPDEYTETALFFNSLNDAKVAALSRLPLLVASVFDTTSGKLVYFTVPDEQRKRKAKVSENFQSQP